MTPQTQSNSCADQTNARPPCGGDQICACGPNCQCGEACVCTPDSNCAG